VTLDQSFYTKQWRTRFLSSDRPAFYGLRTTLLARTASRGPSISNNEIGPHSADSSGSTERRKCGPLPIAKRRVGS
jgi:hypothetical protein